MEYYNNTGADYIAIVKHPELTPVVKIELLDHHETAYAELVEEISAQDVGAISETYKQGVRKTVDFTLFDPNGDFIPNPNDKYFWVGRKFKIYLGLAKTRYYSEDNPLVYSYSEPDIVAYLKALNPDNWNDVDAPIENSPLDELIEIGRNQIASEEDIYWFPKGVFIITDINAVHNNANKTVAISGVDKYGLFGSETGFFELVDTHVIPEDSLITTAILGVLNYDLGNGEVADPISPIIDPYYHNTKIPFEIAKGPGSYIGDLLEEIATMFRADIYYDNNGHLNMWRSMIGEENAALPTIWDFYDTDAEYLNSSLTFNINRIANVVKVVGDNPKATVAPEARAENHNQASPLAIEKIGIKSKYIEVSTIKYQFEAQDYADYQLKMLSVMQNNISFECTLIPHLEVNKLFTLTDRYYHLEKETFLIESITLPLGIGTITISGSNLKELPSY